MPWDRTTTAAFLLMFYLLIGFISAAVTDRGGLIVWWPIAWFKAAWRSLIEEIKA